MKKFFFFQSNPRATLTFVTVLIFLAVSCSKQPATAQTSTANQANTQIAKAPSVTATNTISPEEHKVRNIIAKLSPRAKKEIAINESNIKEFISDLKNVLAVDKSFTTGGDITLLYLADKTHYLPEGYAPRQIIPLTKGNDYNINRNDLSLRKDAYDALVKMAVAARADGVTLLASSSYRSYEYQITVYNKWVQLEGQAEADRISARPGTSQHQLGTVIDFGSIDNTFAETRAGKWMEQHASEYGWSLSFPNGYEDVTGYDWESWHFRFIGTEACNFQKKYFNNIQQFMLEFINEWRKI